MLLNNSNPTNVLVLFLVRLGLYSQTVAEKIITARRIIDKMTGNAFFTTPVPTLAEVNTLADDLEEKEAALDGSHLKTEQRDMAEAALDNALKQLQSYVNTVANGSAEIVLSSGFEVRKPREKAGILPGAESISAVATGISGQIKLKWKPVKGARIYGVQMTTDMNQNAWEFNGESTKASITLDGLTPGQLYFFRVVAMNSAGMGQPSQPAQCRPQ